LHAVFNIVCADYLLAAIRRRCRRAVAAAIVAGLGLQAYKVNINQLMPASHLAKVQGVKCLAYGPAGTGKTPCLNTAPRPAMLACEPGMRSMARSNVPAWQAYTAVKIDEFFTWLFQSREADNFDTVGIDSVSQMAEIKLSEEIVKWKDPRKAYGEMARWVYDHLSGLYFLDRKHIYLIAKEELAEFGAQKRARPYFPGKDLNTKVPHLYDEILRMEKIPHPAVPGQWASAFRTKDDGFAHARDRSGNLAEHEPTDLAYLFNKAMK
jgi:hypothetical protein